MDVTHPLRRRQRGVTLLELVATTATALVVTAVAIPTYSDFTAVQETAAAANTLVGALALVRHDAVTRQSEVVLCASVTGTTCSGGYDWSQGWMGFIDTDRDRVRDSDEPRLLVGNLATKRVKVITSSGRRKIVYQADGSTRGTNATFRICNSRDPDRRRAIILNGAGRTRISKRDASGDPISCE